MSWDPWVKQDPVTEMMDCEHCGESQPVVQGRVVVCQCPKAVDADRLERQRRINWQREQDRNRG